MVDLSATNVEGVRGKDRFWWERRLGCFEEARAEWADLHVGWPILLGNICADGQKPAQGMGGAR